MITFASIPGHPGFTARNDGVIIGKRGVPMVGSTVSRRKEYGPLLTMSCMTSIPSRSQS